MKHRYKLYAASLGCILSVSPALATYAAAQNTEHVITGGVDASGSLSGSDINKNKPITLTVQKKGKNPFDDDQSNAPQVQGVTFTVSKVEGVNVLDDTVRERVMKEYSYDYIVKNNMDINEIARNATDEKGRVQFTGLKPGLYILSQPDNPNSKPQVVMLPLIDAYGTSFTYDDVIVAKNTPDTPATVTTTTPIDNPPVTTTQPVPRTSVNTTVSTYPTTIQTPTTVITTPPGEAPQTLTTSVPVEVLTSTTLTKENSTTQTEQVPGENTTLTETQGVPAPGGTGGGGGFQLFPGGPVVDTGGAAIAAAAGGTLALIALAIVLSGGTGFAGGVFASRRKKKNAS